MPEDNRGKSQKASNPKGIEHKQGTKCNIGNKIIIDQSASHNSEGASYIIVRECILAGCTLLLCGIISVTVCSLVFW